MSIVFFFGENLSISPCSIPLRFKLLRRFRKPSKCRVQSQVTSMQLPRRLRSIILLELTRLLLLGLTHSRHTVLGLPHTRQTAIRWPHIRRAQDSLMHLNKCRFVSIFLATVKSKRAHRKILLCSDTNLY